LCARSTASPDPFRRDARALTLERTDSGQGGPVTTSTATPQLIAADVHCALYDEHRRVFVVPANLDRAEQVAAVYELMRERRQ
jgi:hypothetical protein